MRHLPVLALLLASVIPFVTGAQGRGNSGAPAQRRTETTAGTPIQPCFTSGKLEVNFTQRRVSVGGKEVKLTPTEYALLKLFVLNVGKVLTHTHLLNKVWGPEYSDERQYLHVFVRRLRTKLESDPTNPRYVVTIPGIGYQFKTEPEHHGYPADECKQFRFSPYSYSSNRSENI